MGNILYVVSWDTQCRAITEHCLGDCGKGMIAGVRLEGLAVAPCKSEECDHVTETFELGEYVVPSEGKMTIVGRRLAEVSK